MVVLRIAALDGKVVAFCIVYAVKQQNGVAYHFEAGHTRQRLVAVVSFHGVVAVGECKLVFACSLCGQIVSVRRCARCAEGLYERRSVGFGDGKRCRFGNACPRNAGACDVHRAKSRSVGLPQSKQCGVGRKRTTLYVLVCQLVGLVVRAYPPTLEGVTFTCGSRCAVKQLAA